MKKIINFVLVLAIGIVLGYVFQPTLDKKLAEKSPKLKTWVMERQGDWNKKTEAWIDEKLDSTAIDSTQIED